MIILIASVAWADCQTTSFPPDPTWVDPELFDAEDVRLDAVLRYQRGAPSDRAELRLDGEPVPGHEQPGPGMHWFVPDAPLLPDRTYEFRVDRGLTPMGEATFHTGSGTSSAWEAPIIDRVVIGDPATWEGPPGPCSTPPSTLEGFEIHVTAEVMDVEAPSELLIELWDDDELLEPDDVDVTVEAEYQPGGLLTLIGAVPSDAVCATPVLVNAAGEEFVGERVCPRRGCVVAPVGPGGWGLLLVGTLLGRRRRDDRARDRDERAG